jgi:hypothetical protein
MLVPHENHGKDRSSPRAKKVNFLEVPTQEISCGSAVVLYKKIEATVILVLQMTIVVLIKKLRKD